MFKKKVKIELKYPKSLTLLPCYSWLKKQKNGYIDDSWVVLLTLSCPYAVKFDCKLSCKFKLTFKAPLHKYLSQKTWLLGGLCFELHSYFIPQISSFNLGSCFFFVSCCHFNFLPLLFPATDHYINFILTLSIPQKKYTILNIL